MNILISSLSYDQKTSVKFYNSTLLRVKALERTTERLEQKAREISSKTDLIHSKVVTLGEELTLLEMKLHSISESVLKTRYLLESDHPIARDHAERLKSEQLKTLNRYFDVCQTKQEKENHKLSLSLDEQNLSTELASLQTTISRQKSHLIRCANSLFSYASQLEKELQINLNSKNCLNAIETNSDGQPIGYSKLDGVHIINLVKTQENETQYE